MKDHPSLKSVKITFACWSPTVLGAKDDGPNPPLNSKSDPKQWHSQRYSGSHKERPPLYSIKTSFVCRFLQSLQKMMDPSSRPFKEGHLALPLFMPLSSR